MKCSSNDTTPSFTAIERDYIRGELCVSFGAAPSVFDGFLLRVWKSGPYTGKPRLPKAVEALIGRGLMELRPGKFGIRAFFTDGGLRELRKLAADRRYLDAKQFSHVLSELGVSQEFPGVATKG